MNEDQLRALVRASIARHLGTAPNPGGADGPPGALPPPGVQGDPSHFRYALPPSGGPCLIEPGVACNHCGYCESHGH
jgi:hypothetical protein